MEFGEYHMSSIDLKNYKNLCKDERQKIIVSRDDNEKSIGKKCEHRANNKNSSLEQFTKKLTIMARRKPAKTI